VVVTAGRAKETVTVEVGATILQEQAVASPSSAATLLGLLDVVSTASTADVVPLAMTDCTISFAIESISEASAMLAMLTHLGTIGAGVVVASTKKVSVSMTRVIEVTVVVESALVVEVLPRM
jgi:hypothetical protein